MSIVFPLACPSSPGFNSFNLATNSVVGAAVSPFTGQTQTIEWPAEAWDLQVGLPPMLRADAEEWLAFLISLRGMSGTFLIGDPNGTVPQGVATGFPEILGLQIAGSKSITTTGWTPSTTNILRAGDYIQMGFDTTQRLYKVLTNTNSDSSGHATLDIFPRLREPLADSTDIVTTNCAGCFRLSANRTQWSIDVATMYGITFQAIEALGPPSDEVPLPDATDDVPEPIVDGGSF